MMERKHLLYEESEGIGFLTFNRPKAYNALNSEVIAELDAALDEIAKTDIRCLVLRGAGEKAFIAGADIGEMRDMGPEQARIFSEQGNAALKKLEDLPMPTIAAIQGHALGGGLEVALHCDLRIASVGATFAFPEVSLGIIPGYGGLQRLSALIGAGKARQLAFSAEKIGAKKAYEIGLVESIVQPDDLEQTALDFARKIAQNAPFAVRRAKAVLRGSIGKTAEEAEGLEIPAFSECFDTEDQKEAMRAFVEKRPHAPFTGR